MKLKRTFEGIMIDSARLIERPQFYYRLVDFMAEWGLNTLLFHFTDDHGCSVQLPGFSELASPRAFSPKEVTKFIKYAAKKSIEVIPELETFGHTRFITDKSKYSHLLAGKKQKELVFNAIDPLSPATHKLVKNLIRSTSELFPSKYLHIGCDEVDMKDYCKSKGGIDEAITWVNYVNSIIQYTIEAGKIPMIWGDHPSKDPLIAELLRKDVIMVDWRYGKDVKDKVHQKLHAAGFKNIIVAPSVACWEYRFLPSHIALENTRKMAAIGFKNKSAGMLTTIWCPYRYIQNSVWYGVAYSAYARSNKGKVDLKNFHKVFARKVFGEECNPELNGILEKIRGIEIDILIVKQIQNLKAGKKIDSSIRDRLKKIRSNARTAFALMTQYCPGKNKDIYEAIVLAFKCAYLISLALMPKSEISETESKEYKRLRTQVMDELSKQWDLARFPDDPQKFRPKFIKQDDQYAILLISTLPRSI